MIAALKAIDRAVVLDGSSSVYREMRARLLLELGRSQDALREARMIQAVGGGPGTVAEIRGLALANLGQSAEAESALKKAMQIKPSVQSGIALTDLLESRESWLESAEVYSQLETIDPESAAHWRIWRAHMLNLESIHLYEIGSLDEALRLSRNSVNVHLNKDNKSSLVNILGLKVIDLIENNNLDRARQYAGELAKYDPGEAHKLISIIDDKNSLQRDRGNTARRPRVRNDVNLYLSLGDGHWVSKIMERGKYIKLEDGSLWEVSSIDRIDSSLWLITESITVVDNSNALYPYRLINTDSGDAVEAKLLSQ